MVPQGSRREKKGPVGTGTLEFCLLLLFFFILFFYFIY